MALTRRLTSHESALQMDSPKGLMLHGEVGTGKSMLIDLFADCLPNRKKRRSHFNTFMLETFAKLESLRAQRSRAGSSRLPSQLAFAEDDYSLLWLAKDMIQTSPILFLDEFQMPDRVASKILTNLMTGFFQLGGVLVATSNRMPEELAKAAGIGFAPSPQRGFGWQLGFGRRKQSTGMYGGSNEFAAFLDVLKARCEVWEMEGGKDWRRIESGSVAPIKDVDTDSLADSGIVMDEIEIEEEPAKPEEGLKNMSLPKHYISTIEAQEHGDPLDAALIAATNGKGIDTVAWMPETMKVYGRTIDIPRAHGGVAMWTFDELCKATFGPADYITLASTYHTLIVTEVPVLNWLMKNEARRFITLLDALYECRCKLFVSAAAGPDDIFFPEEQKPKSNEEGDSGDSVYSETLSEVYQDATAPFRPNILMQNPNYAEPDNEPDYTHARLAGLLRADSLEDDSPNAPAVSRGAKGGSASNPFGRSFGKTDAEMERKPVDPDEVRYTARPDFQKTSAFTGEDERFAYKRAESRLWEMCSQRWWARNEPDWHRPLPQEIRRWERVGEDIDMPKYPEAGSLANTEVRMGGAVEDATRDERSFKRFSSPTEVQPPFQPEREAPKKISWTHIWGTMKWGARAGAWGQGPEGLKDRGNEKR